MMIVFRRLLARVALFTCLLPKMWGQELGSDTSNPSASPAATTARPASEVNPVVEQAPPDKRVFGVLPNYRTANETAIYTPITTKQKFTIASKDSFDYPLLLLGAAIGAVLVS